MRNILKGSVILTFFSDLVFGILLILFILGFVTKKVMDIAMLYLIILAFINLLIYWNVLKFNKGNE